MLPEKPKKVIKTKMVPYSPKWERAADRLARIFAPNIYPCNDCNHPVVKGYCCTYCGSTNPEGA